jgi:hypothetical protein
MKSRNANHLNVKQADSIPKANQNTHCCFNGC